MGLDNYLLAVRKLNNMGRWSTEFMHLRTTVSEHSFFVAQIGQMLALIEEENGQQLNWEKLFKKLLNHDVVEAITGDIISTVKHQNQQMGDLVSLLEKEVVEENLLDRMEEPYKSVYRELLFDGKDHSLEGKILQAADNIDALMECIGEIKLQNFDPFTEKYFSILARLELSELVSVKYFRSVILQELITDCQILNNKN
ncbi:MAG: HD domain-containing protein [Desulfitobacteriaceae bacterium]|nr:HD domain-containing protein [Desulfitobacteriaceae bacterium]MDD4346612.1 HD domain-containing protein [Desulfitobacteriaceae bacterium]